LQEADTFILNQGRTMAEIFEEARKEQKAAE